MKTSKLFFYINIFLLLLIGNSANCQWIQQALGIEQADYLTRHLVSVNQNTVWGAGDYLGAHSNFFCTTLNGGTNWLVSNVPNYPEYYITSLSAVSEDTAFMIMFDPDSTNYHVLIRTYDRGFSWLPINTIFFPHTSINKIHFWNSNKGLAVCSNDSLHFHRFYSTEDGGNSWTNYDSSISLNQYSNIEQINYHFCLKDSIIKLISSRGRLFTSNDWGKHWFVQLTPFANLNIYYPNYRIAFTENMQHGLLYGRYDLIYETFDGGLTWTQILTTGMDSDSEICWIPGTNNTWLRFSVNGDGCFYSTDGGHNWTEFTQLQGKRIGASAWYDNHTGWISELTHDPQPTITGMFKFDSTFLSINNIKSNTNNFTIYPNPCQNTTNLSIKGMQGELVKLSIISSYGQELLKTNLLIPDNQFTYNLNLSSFPSGIYIVNLNTIHTNYQQKIIIY